MAAPYPRAAPGRPAQVGDFVGAGGGERVCVACPHAPCAQLGASACGVPQCCPPRPPRRCESSGAGGPLLQQWQQQLRGVGGCGGRRGATARAAAACAVVGGGGRALPQQPLGRHHLRARAAGGAGAGGRSAAVHRGHHLRGPRGRRGAGASRSATHRQGDCRSMLVPCSVVPACSALPRRTGRSAADWRGSTVIVAAAPQSRSAAALVATLPCCLPAGGAGSQLGPLHHELCGVQLPGNRHHAAGGGRAGQGRY